MSADDPTPDDRLNAPPLESLEAALPSEAPSPEQARLAAIDALTPIVEALIFASPEPLSFKALVKLLDSEPREHVEAALAAVRDVYTRPGGLQLIEVAGGFQIVTRPELHEWVRRLFRERTTQKLSVQALETLAVIAYRQPITAPEITEVRGVNTSGVLTTLIERKLVKIVGRKQVVGRPFMYATTKEFLDRFGLRDLQDLPKVEDMAELLGFDALSGLEADSAPATLPFDTVGDEGAGGRGSLSGEARDVVVGQAEPSESPATDEQGEKPADEPSGSDEGRTSDAAVAGDSAQGEAAGGAPGARKPPSSVH